MVTLNVEEQRRAAVLARVDRGEMSLQEAANVTGLSIGHIRRLLARYREKGPMALAHGNRGRKPPRALDRSTKEKVVDLARTKYAGLDHRRLAKLLVDEGIKLSPSSVRRILIASGGLSAAAEQP